MVGAGSSRSFSPYLWVCVPGIAVYLALKPYSIPILISLSISVTTAPVYLCTSQVPYVKWLSICIQCTHILLYTLSPVDFLLPNVLLEAANLFPVHPAAQT